jgi:CubicO group peptidase (beta-lactamase class C family)
VVTQFLISIRRVACSRSAGGLWLQVCLLAASGDLAAQPAEPAPAPVAAPVAERRGPVDAVEVEAFLDGLMTAQLNDRGIAGATVAVVRDGLILLAKGYGVADVPNRIAVDPDRTLFRIGSVTKLFTATAVMQLVQDGRLDLDADVTRYLDFEIPATFAEPITVRHLLTHTPGFEEDIRLLFTYEPGEILPLREWLVRTMPARVRPPGTFASYSNYGTTLAGYVVERLSGLAWDDYLERHVLDPLGMSHTTGRQPLPPHLAGDMSDGYIRTGGTWERQRWEITTGAAPAGAMSSTARDMGRFMLAHLGGGALHGMRILGEETTHDMHARHFVHDPRINGFGLGFYELSSHGLRIIGHGGNTAWFHSVLALVPEHDVGVFVSYNTNTGNTLSFGPFLTAFLDHYFPAVPPATEVPDDFAARVQGLAGTYRFNRMSHTTFQKAMGLAMTVAVRPMDGTLLASTPLGEMRFVEEAPLLFREEMGQARVAFRTDDAGTATHAFLSLTPMMALERVPWHGLPALHGALLGIGLLIFVGVLATGAARSLVRWRTGDTRPAAGPAIVLGRRAMVLAAAAYLGFVVSLAVLAVDLDPWEFFAGPLTGLKIALAFPVAGVLATLTALGALGLAIGRGEGTGWARLRLAGAVAAGLLVAWSLHYWNLLGWRM